MVKDHREEWMVPMCTYSMVGGGDQEMKEKVSLFTGKTTATSTIGPVPDFKHI